MKLIDASSYFDRTLALDPDTYATLFKGQVGTYDDSKRDANAAYRRILSVRPGTSIPASRVVNIFGTVWIVGSKETDGLEELHRDKYVLQRAPYKLKVSRLTQFLAGVSASELWSSAQWVKDAKQLEVSSETPQIFEVSMAEGSDVRVQDVLWNASSAYLVLAPHIAASGILAATCVKLDQVAPVVATLATRTYDPVTGAYTTSGGTSVNALKVRWQSLYAYGSQAAERYQEGDLAIVLVAGTTASTGSLVTISGVTYQTLAVLDIAGAVVLHARAV